MFRVRNVLEELEAHLASAQGGSPAAGKAERKRYGDGEERLKVRARKLSAPDGAPAQILVDGSVVAEARVERGRFSIDLTSREAVVPRVAEGQVLEIRVDNQVLLAGRFSPE